MTAIPGATSSTYVPVTADIGQNITVTVTATNSAGNATATATAVGPVTAPIPVNSAPPVISGSTIVGSTLTSSNGTWSGSPTYTYQWTRAGANISGATGTTYLTVSADIGTMINVIVTATNSGGSANASAAAVGPITAAAPTNVPTYYLYGF